MLHRNLRLRLDPRVKNLISALFVTIILLVTACQKQEAAPQATSVAGEWLFSSVVSGTDNLTGHFLIDPTQGQNINEINGYFIIGYVVYPVYAANYVENSMIALAEASPTLNTYHYRGYLILYNPIVSRDFNTITIDSVVYSQVKEINGSDTTYQLASEKRNVTIRRNQ
jgi:hypothetical protein